MTEPIAQVVPDTEPVVTPAPIEESIVERVNKNIAAKSPDSATSEDKFSVKNLDSITDPAAKKFAEDAYKSFQADYTRKMQEIASTRKDLEALKQQSEQGKPWTPERIKALLNDPAFVQSAQQVTNESNGQLTDEEWSTLTPTEKQSLKQNNTMLQSVMSELDSMKTQAEDQKLKQKYASYNPESINKFQSDLLTGSYRATREDIYKVVNYEDAIKQAYELGQKDRQLNLYEKQNGATNPSSTSITSPDSVPDRQPRENTVDYFKRLALRRLQGQK